jgi:hypothetical protein
MLYCRFLKCVLLNRQQRGTETCVLKRIRFIAKRYRAFKTTNLTRRTTIFLLTFLTVALCFGQTGNGEKRTASVYSNWMSIDYLNCLKTNLPCECEKSREYFLISLEATKKFVLLYDGRANYDYNLYQFKTISRTNFEVYNEQYSQALFRDTIAVVGQIKILSDTLFFTDHPDKQTKFILYSSGDSDGFFKEHIKLLNSAMTARGYDNLNKTLNSDSLNCWCNWEIDGGINSVFGTMKGRWILEKKENQLLIYEWTNPPGEKQIDLIIEKKLFKKFIW